MSFDAMHWAWIQKQLPPNQRLVLMALADRAQKHDEYGNRYVCWPRRKTIAEDAGLSLSTVQRCLDSLQQDYYIEIKPQFSDQGDLMSNLYFINVDSKKFPAARRGPSGTPGVGSVGTDVGSGRINNNQVIEPSKLNRINEPPTGRGVEHKPIDDEFTETMVTEFQDRFLGGAKQVREIIDIAMNHPASKKWLDKRRGIRNWLNTEARRFEERRLGGGGNGTASNTRGAVPAAHKPTGLEQWA